MEFETNFKNLRSLKDKELIFRAERLAKEERELLSKVLYHIREIERRRLFSSLGYKSIFDFSVKKLGYSEDQAYRRVQAARLLQEIPEIEEKINSGELNLTHLSLAQNLFKSEKKQKKEIPKFKKLEIFEKISSKPVREAESLLFSYSSSPVELKRDQVNSVSKNHIELKFTGSKELLEKIETLKGYLAHTDPNISMGELFERLCDLGLEHFAPSNKGLKGPTRNREASAPPLTATQPSATQLNAPQPTATLPSAAPKKSCVRNAGGRNLKEVVTKKLEFSENVRSIEEYLIENSRLNGKYISPKIRRKVFKDSNNRCTICKSTFALETDHRRPRSLGGTNDPKYLRALCRSCNQRLAIEKLGWKQMECYLK